MTQELLFEHIGIPVDTPQAEESWVPDSVCWATNPRTNPQRIEYNDPPATKQFLSTARPTRI